MYLLVVMCGVRWGFMVWVLFTNTYVGVRLRIAGHGFVFGGVGMSRYLDYGGGRCPVKESVYGRG